MDPSGRREEHPDRKTTPSAGAPSPDAARGTDPDSWERMTEEITDPPHPASRFDAGNGQGTVSGPPRDQAFQERPVLDGSTQSPEAEATVPNPYREQADPATIKRQPALNNASSDRWLIASSVAAVVVAAVLLLLARFDPVWCGVGICVTLVGLLLMLLVRGSRARRAPSLKLMAGLMAVVWLVPLAIILSVMIGRADQIW